MDKQAGLWIDHSKAVIVMISVTGEEIKEISSDMERHERFTEETASSDDFLEDVRNRQIADQINNYYEQVMAVVGDADTIQIFGPGEAKDELVKRFEQQGLKAHILTIETVDKMTGRQIATKVRTSIPS
ncbi:MAG: hypothetical protein IPJ46_20670 [Anaerolineales bacterium]|nr:hypothetical protein [Anaerolineales bacterium]